jgi:hypothetical protein
MGTRLLALFGVLAFAIEVFPSAVSAQQLPTYEDFRRVDRLRRMTGQLQTAELLKVTQIDHALIERVARQATNDYQAVWGAAELIADWPTKRTLFETALTSSETNEQVALRYACAAAEHHDSETAVPLLRAVEEADTANIVPWFVEMKLRQAQNKGLADLRTPPSWAIRYRDFAADAARARIHMLEAADYSPYAARRLGFMPDMPVLAMARESAEKPIQQPAARLLSTLARAMQDRPVYLVTELVGETLEGAASKVGQDGQSSAEASLRAVELDRRRDEIRSMLSAVERNVVDIATEAEMVQYFNNVLSVGEESAMRRLAEMVQSGHPSP